MEYKRLWATKNNFTSTNEPTSILLVAASNRPLVRLCLTVVNQWGAKRPLTSLSAEDPHGCWLPVILLKSDPHLSTHCAMVRQGKHGRYYYSFSGVWIILLSVYCSLLKQPSNCILMVCEWNGKSTTSISTFSQQQSPNFTCPSGCLGKPKCRDGRSLQLVLLQMWVSAKQSLGLHTLRAISMNQLLSAI